MFISCQILLILLLKAVGGEALGLSRRIRETVNTLRRSLSYKGVVVGSGLFCDVLPAERSLGHYPVEPILLVPPLDRLAGSVDSELLLPEDTATASLLLRGRHLNYAGRIFRIDTLFVLSCLCDAALTNTQTVIQHLGLR